MPTVAVPQIINRLFEHPTITAKIKKAYGLDPAESDPNTLASLLVQAFDQQPTISEKVDGIVDNTAVFRAAVRALASNSRSWSTFLSFEKRLETILSNYNPLATHLSVNANPRILTNIQQCLPGQTTKADARAIVQWARLLTQGPDYYDSLKSLKNTFATLDIKETEVIPVMAAFLGNPTKKAIKVFPLPSGLASWKLPGMGAILASEFLRNLRWSGFKPDRHIKRLFRLWFPDVIEACTLRGQELAKMIHSSSKDLREFFTFSLVGLAVTPQGHSFTEVDNLIWALGAYVEKKGKESTTCYRIS